MSTPRHAGFTLIELMIVVAIIAILAAIALPQYADYVARSEFSEATYVGEGLKSQVTGYFNETAKCPTNAATGFLPATSYSGTYVEKVDLGGTPPICTISVQFKAASVALPLRSKIATLSATSQGGTVVWSCSALGIAPRYLPQTCR